MTAPRNLTEPFIRSLGPAPAGKRVAYSDALVPGLRVRVTDTGHKSLYPLASFRRLQAQCGASAWHGWRTIVDRSSRQSPAVD